MRIEIPPKNSTVVLAYQFESHDYRQVLARLWSKCDSVRCCLLALGLETKRNLCIHTNYIHAYIHILD